MVLIPEFGTGLLSVSDKGVSLKSYFLAHRQGLGASMPIANAKHGSKLDLRLSLLYDFVNDPSAKVWAHIFQTEKEWRYQFFVKRGDQ